MAELAVEPAAPASTRPSPTPDAAQTSAPPVPRERPATPAESPLEMPTQDLRRFRATSEMAGRRGRPAASTVVARLVVFGGGLGLTAWGAWEMYQVVSVSRVTALQWALLMLFTVNFSWIAVSFASACVGFVALLRAPRPPRIPERLGALTAVVMPVYNEAPARCFAALQAMAEDVARTGHGASFHYWILSDTTDPDIWIAEERAFLALRERLGSDFQVYYRHRAKNTHRKAGNIADFVTRWGGAYEHMLVLDADSVMTGDCIVTLAAAMEADPNAGIVQSLPLVINRNTLFARVQQFAARIYGPVIAAGLATWSGRDGNYWGHNAIIRTRAFAAHCGLPDLVGRPPFGGHIMSHDFVEAALIRRAGYGVTMLPALGGSYEESPPSLIDLSARDRRWCQGNLQHMRVIGAAGLRWPSRQHFATGIMSYLASPFWFAQLIVGLLLVVQTTYARPEYFTNEFSLAPRWPVFDAERSLRLFGITMGVLLAPKLFGLLLALRERAVRRGAGGSLRLVASAFVETIASALTAPVMMLIQSKSVAQILLGKDTGWNPQRRDDGTIPLSSIVRTHRWHVALGVITGIAAFLISPSLAAWMSPTIAGLLLAIVLSWAGGLLTAGLWLRRLGLLATPEETTPAAVVTRSNALSRELHAEELRQEATDAILALHSDSALRERHVGMLPPLPRRRRGHVEPDRAVAVAKLMDARCVEDAAEWLRPKERMIVLHDRALLILLAALPRRADGEAAFAVATA